ncbi:ubiquitin carboxyl-terminal hydrolase 37-like isoform X1 [Trachinotus anak]|uniref:ubiquitin carboxyl-terminal hydrolase 37-like isoform X1 n=1 Tax=Trachinotus anak TaxID=443729 RepID=UPI0039F22937
MFPVILISFIFPFSLQKSTAVIQLVADESVGAPDAPAVTKKKGDTTPWIYRLFGRPLTKKNPDKKEKQSVSTSDDKTPRKTAKKPRWWHFWKKRCKVAPSPEEQPPKEECHSTPQRDKVVELKDQSEKEGRPKDDSVPEDQPKKKKKKVPVTNNKTLRQQQIHCLGFPNPAQFCYINSCLQSLLTLEDFVRDISQQEQVWSLIPEGAIMRSLTDISGSHFSTDVRHKTRLLSTFKKAVSLWNQEFEDLHQKDAHEFLTAVLQQVRCLGLQLQVLAPSIDRTYSCPVEDHLVFKMLNTRKCKSCHAESSREEDFTNLSLHLVPGAETVQRLLECYLMETELEYTCECGATRSGQRSSFINLPRVLVLHLKRFRFTPTLQLIKDHNPVVLSRELVVPSNQGGGCYSLVSTISHIGATATRGHYICDGVDPDVGQIDPTDRWFTYNDAAVTETSGATVCDRRRRTAYILFYRRQF